MLFKNNECKIVCDCSIPELSEEPTGSFVIPDMIDNIEGFEVILNDVLEREVLFDVYCGNNVITGWTDGKEAELVGTLLDGENLLLDELSDTIGRILVKLGINEFESEIEFKSRTYGYFDVIIISFKV